MARQQSEIEVLKAQVKTLKRIVYGVVCLFVAGMAVAATSMQQGVPDVIQAKKFEVVSTAGHVVARLAFNPKTDQSGSLDILNKDGQWVVGICGDTDAGGIGAWNTEGKQVLSLTADSDGGHVGIYNSNGKGVVGMGVQEDGSGLLSIINKDGKTTFQAPIKDADGS